MTYPKILAVLLLGDGAAVSIDRLVEALWDDAPPATARRQVRNRVASLRRVLKGNGNDPIETVLHGYRIPKAAADCDYCTFKTLAVRARSLAEAGRLDEAVRAADEGLAVWTGPALMGLNGRLFEAASHRLEESRLATVEARASWQLRLGRSDAMVGELFELVAALPYRQRLLSLYLSALQLSGRTAEALKAYEIHRLRLDEELGIEPGQELQRLYVSLLRDERPFVDGPAA
ncbi:AfsR/SARP family transcriptional regulator [Glycomyces sp. NPDC047369]